jgi:hypothetical protein
MGIGLMRGWLNAKIYLGKKLRSGYHPFKKNNTPSFHCSIIPSQVKF